MIQHFLIVGVAYIIAIILNALDILPTTWWCVGIQVGLMMAIDYVVHTQNHHWNWIPVPWTTVMWIGIVIFATAIGLVAQGWQVAVLLGCQALWDNSWHSVENHRPGGKPTTHTDFQVLRWGSVVVAIVSITLPFFF